MFVGVASDRDGQNLPNVVMALKPASSSPPGDGPHADYRHPGGAVVPALHFCHPCLAPAWFSPIATRCGAPHQVIRAANRSGSPCTSPATRHRRSASDKEGAIVAYRILHRLDARLRYVADTPWTAISGDNGWRASENVAPGDVN